MEERTEYKTTIDQKETAGSDTVERRVIKPCPFCGGEALLNTFENMYEKVWSVSCCGEKDSHCAGLEGGGFRDSEDEVIEHWNKRAL